ncbi:MAG TPA: TRAP transporter small permease [Burkholderiales bacterium]
MHAAFAAWRAFQDKVLAPAAALLLIGSTLLGLLEVVRRYVLGLSFDWQQDAVTYFMLSGVFLYFSISQRKDAHLQVTLVPELLMIAGPRAQLAAAIVKLVALLFAFVFLVAVVWWGIPEIEESIAYDVRSESLAFLMWPFLAVLLASFAFMAVTMLFQLWFMVEKLRGRPVPEEPADREATH